LFAATFALFIAAASAPSPLYAIFQQQWHFSAITLTVVFAVYAFALLVALLFFGSLSDHIGRRPVLLGALAIEVASMAVFASAQSVTWLIVARLLQGLGTGIATAVVSAGLIDTEPKNRPGLASLFSTILPVASLGMGALFAGLLVAYGSWPTHLVFWLLCVLSIVTSIGIIRMPETITRKPGWQQSLVPIVSIPPGTKGPFLTVGLGLVASWALVGLYLSLGPSVMDGLLPSRSHMVGSLIIVALTAAGAFSSALLRKRKDAQLLVVGAIFASIGLSICVYGIATSSAALFFVGTIVAGVGFGPALTGGFRSIMSHAPSDQRAGLASVVFIVSYLALSIPVVVAGIATVKVGLNTTVIGYNIGCIILYLLTLALLKLRLRATPIH